jgi:hypothetical protein
MKPSVDLGDSDIQEYNMFWVGDVAIPDSVADEIINRFGPDLNANSILAYLFSKEMERQKKEKDNEAFNSN